MLVEQLRKNFHHKCDAISRLLFVLADKDKSTEGTTRGSKVYAIMLYIVTVIFINKSQVNCLNIYIYIHGAVWFFFSMLE